ncbi:MAG: hypothetical protein SFT93_02510 [Rickettsiaceae bacterium]|nr:hypothetical protein [Rickettsiaceae bacterium]
MTRYYNAKVIETKKYHSKDWAYEGFWSGIRAQSIPMIGVTAFALGTLNPMFFLVSAAAAVVSGLSLGALAGLTLLAQKLR